MEAKPLIFHGRNIKLIASFEFGIGHGVVDAAQEKPGIVSYGSAGVGNTTHLVGALFARAAGVDMMHVPYKGSALTDLLGARIDAMFLGTTLARESTAKARAYPTKIMPVLTNVNSPVHHDELLRS